MVFTCDADEDVDNAKTYFKSSQFLSSEITTTESL